MKLGDTIYLSGIRCSVIFIHSKARFNDHFFITDIKYEPFRQNYSFVHYTSLDPSRFI